MEERRKFVRLEAPIQVKYRIAVRPVTENSSTSKDISAGGVRILIGEKLPPGLPVELEINIPDYGKIICASGEIVWQDEIVVGREISHETGIKFVKIAPEDQKKIAKYVYKQLSERVKNPEE